jgi:hypothetical protein
MLEADPNLSFISSSYTPSLVSGYQYQGSSGTFYDVYKITFSGLNLSAAGGVLYDFGIGATPGTESSLFLHGSNAALSGSTQDGADGLFLGFTGPPYSLAYVIDPGCGRGASLGQGQRHQRGNRWIRGSGTGHVRPAGH